MKRKQVINLYELKKSKKWAMPLRDMVIDYLGDLLYEITDEQEFIFQIMKGIYPINKTLKNEMSSIGKACNQLFSILTIRKGKFFRLNDDGPSTQLFSSNKEYYDGLRYVWKI